MSASIALDNLTDHVKSLLVTSHAGRLIRMALTYGEPPQEAARRALDYVMKVTGPVDPDLVAQIARGLLEEAESEALEIRKERVS